MSRGNWEKLKIFSIEKALARKSLNVGKPDPGKNDTCMTELSALLRDLKRHQVEEVASNDMGFVMNRSSKTPPG